MKRIETNKWCSYCEKHDHNDDECRCTRASPPPPEPPLPIYYTHPPTRPVGSVLVRYVHAGPLLPRRFDDVA